MSQLVRNTVTNPIFIELQTIDSTNNYALQLIHAGLAQAGTCIFTHLQTAGKGQRNKNWHSSAGENILLSTIIAPKALPVLQQQAINRAVAIAVHQFFSRYASDEVRIKWPNDLYWQDRKAGGILIENIVGKAEVQSQSEQPVLKWSVIGTGININQTSFDAAATKPVSLKQITGKTFNTVELAQELANIILTQCQNLHDNLLQQYNQLLYKKDQTVLLKKDNQIFEAVIKETNQYGELIITRNGIDEIIQHGEVEWVSGL